MKWVFAVMFILWAAVTIGTLADRQWTADDDGDNVTVVKMGAKP